MRTNPLVNGYFYHVYNRGVEKRDIFIEKWDYLRFLETLNFYRFVPLPTKLSDFRRGIVRYQKIDNQLELAKIHCYCLMPNHFHLLLQQKLDKGITHFLRKVSDSYTRYYNTKYERIGPLFQGTFKAKLVDKDEYVLQVSKYIHRNSFELPLWKNKIYPYSSYDYYLNEKKHPFCDSSFILSYYSSTNPELSYRSFVEEGKIEKKTSPFLFEEG